MTRRRIRRIMQFHSVLAVWLIATHGGHHMEGALQLSALDVARILARIFGPEIYDAPPFNGGDPFRRRILAQLYGPLPDPWSAVALNPQPLPPKERFAVLLADAHLADVFRIEQAALDFGDGFAERGIARSRQVLADIEELCPRPFTWPKGWPVPPRPFGDEDMQSTELFLFGMRFLAAADLLEVDQLKEGVTNVGNRAVGMALGG